MKFNKLLFILIIVTILISSCKEEEIKSPGTIDFEFDNVAIENAVANQLQLASPGSTDYPYLNALNQKFNINLLRYYITAIELTGPNGETFMDELKTDVSSSKGYYLVDEAKPSSQLISLKNVPAGEYNKVTFTVGVDSSGVVNGAAGGTLDPATCNMFWSWNSGYVALKFEGQSEVSVGGAGGESVTTANPKGIAYHIGGWKDKTGTAFVYNNKKVSLTFDENAVVESGRNPHVHLYFDVLNLVSGHTKIDFTGNHNVHRPIDGKDMAHNMEESFLFDHIHQ
jgi:hypothetical protein